MTKYGEETMLILVNNVRFRKAEGRYDLKSNWCARHPNDWVSQSNLEEHHIHYLMDLEGNERKDVLCKRCHRATRKINTELVDLCIETFGYLPKGLEWARLRDWIYRHFLKTSPARWKFAHEAQIRFWLRRKLARYKTKFT